MTENCNKCGTLCEEESIDCSNCGTFCIECAEGEDGWYITMHPHHNRDLCPRCVHIAKEAPEYYGIVCRHWDGHSECLVLTPYDEKQRCDCPPDSRYYATS